MSFGKLYGEVGNTRTNICLIAAKANDISLELVNTSPCSGDAEYQKINPLDKIPTFIGSNGLYLTECLAIAIYLTSQNEKTTLLGKTKQDYASILRWISFSNSELIPTAGGWFLPLVGRAPYNKKSVEDSSKQAGKIFEIFEKHLTSNTFLVGERITLADIYAAASFGRSFEYLLGHKWRLAHPAITRWHQTIVNQPVYKAVIPDVTYIEEGLKNVAPKKEASADKPKKAPAPAKEAEEEEKPAPKPKHPLESLPKPSMILDDWKRKYSNEDTRTVAMPWFWEHYNPEEYSLWKIDYKYNSELTLPFMSNNLIGGFFARLEASRKFIFGAASVYGEMNDSIIQGAFLVRGQEHLPAFDVGPDYVTYDFTKLDSSKAEDKKFVEDQWAQDTSIKANGKDYECAEGKVFK